MKLFVNVSASRGLHQDEKEMYLARPDEGLILVLIKASGGRNVDE